jgi:hypothetical protein
MTTTIYAADRSALLIVDPYNDFMSAGGKLYEATKETAEAVGFYDHMRTLIPAIRKARLQVIIVPHHRWREGDYDGWKHMNPTQARGNQSQGFAAGSWGGARSIPNSAPAMATSSCWSTGHRVASPIPISTPNSHSGGSRSSSSSAWSRTPASNPPRALAWSLATTSV